MGREARAGAGRRRHGRVGRGRHRYRAHSPHPHAARQTLRSLQRHFDRSVLNGELLLVEVSYGFGVWG